jgi:hypothetical protein
LCLFSCGLPSIYLLYMSAFVIVIEHNGCIYAYAQLFGFVWLFLCIWPLYGMHGLLK